MLRWGSRYSVRWVSTGTACRCNGGIRSCCRRWWCGWARRCRRTGWPRRCGRSSPPATWRKVVQGSVLRLRRTFGPSSIETTAGRLPVGGARRRGGLPTVRAARRSWSVLLAAGEFDRAAVALGQGVGDVAWAPRSRCSSRGRRGRSQAARLAELRRIAEESLLEARLHLGEHRDVVPIAEARVAEEPFREHRWALLALALYRCGRQADALRALKRARHDARRAVGDRARVRTRRAGGGDPAPGREPARSAGTAGDRRALPVQGSGAVRRRGHRRVLRP